MDLDEILIYLIYPVVAGIIVAILIGAFKKLGFSWEIIIPSHGDKLAHLLGYYKNVENQWVHQTRQPLSNLKQAPVSSVPTFLAQQHRYVKTKWLRKKIATYIGTPSVKHYFLEPCSDNSGTTGKLSDTVAKLSIAEIARKLNGP